MPKEVVIYKSKAMYDRMCVPLDALFNSRVGQGLELKSLTRLSRDLQNSWGVFVACSALAFFVGGLFIVALKHRARLVIWLFIALFWALLVTASSVSGVHYS